MIVYANSRFEGMFGYGQGELIGKHVSILNAPSERAPEEVAEEIVKQLDENGEWFGEVHNIKKDGTCFWSRAKIVEFEHPVHGKVDVNVLEDVTERRNAEVALRQSEERLRILIESAEDIIIMQDKDGKYLYYNGTPRYGIGTGDVVGKKPFDIFEPSIAERIINQTKEVLESGQSKTSENQVPWQGEILWFSDQVSPVEDDTGNIVATVTISRNITEHKKMEETLLKSEERWRSLVTSAPNIIMLVDGDGTIHFINQTVSGIEPKDVIGKKSLYEYIEPEYHDVVRKTTNEVFNTGKLGSYEIRGVGPDGTTSWYQTKVGPVKDGQRIVALILISSDVTEHKQVEEERQRAAKLESIGTLAGGIAHDFNNLLTGIMGNIGLAKRYMEPKGKAFERLEEAEKASIRARDLTQQLLTFARGGAPIKKLTAIAGLVKESITLALSGSNVMSDFSIPDDLWPIEIDEVQINQALSNITINAVQAMPNGGIISIRTSNLVINKKTTLPLSNGNYVEIAIADHGTGIPKEHLSRMFEPYFTTKQKGSGLGLATAYSIIKNHNGHIAVKSTISVGTTVHIYLPAVKERAPKMKEQEEQPALIGQGRVLVMDDEETIRDFLYAELTEVGYEVELTSDGAKAIERYMGAKEAGKPFDAVILDLTIPGGMGGKEAIKKLLEIDPDVKAIVSSGYATDPIMSDYKKYGFSAVVTKPYSVEQLEKTLQGLLRKKK
jgi:PAS domain S-box-containing protein